MIGAGQILTAAVVSTFLAVAAAGLQTTRLRAAKAAHKVDQIELAACGARLQNLIEDLRSDNEVDNLPPDALRYVPDHWLLVEHE